MSLSDELRALEAGLSKKRDSQRKHTFNNRHVYTPKPGKKIQFWPVKVGALDAGRNESKVEK